MSAPHSKPVNYGHGKLRIYRSLFGTNPSGGYAPTLSPITSTLPAGAATTIPIEASDPDDPLETLTFDVDRDYDGTWETVLPGPALPLDAAEIGQQTFKIRVRDRAGHTAVALVRLDIVPPPEASSSALVAGGGWGCAQGSGGRGAAWWIAALGTASTVLRRRIRRRIGRRRLGA